MINNNSKRFGMSVVAALLFVALGCSSEDGNARESTVWSQDDTCRARYEGPIGRDLTSLIESMPCKNGVLELDSIGGLETDAIIAANAIAERSVVIEVNRYCVSACVDFILPAATAVKFINQPIVAVHGNPAAMQFLMTHYSPPGIENCRFAEYQSFADLYRRRGANLQFFHNQLAKLGVRAFEVSPPLGEDACPHHNIVFEVDYWLPSAAELRSGMQIEVDGETCAPDACQRQELRRLLSGRSVRIGTRTVQLR